VAHHVFQKPAAPRAAAPDTHTAALAGLKTGESMKLTAEREKLLAPLQAVIGVVERRQTMPVLANVLPLRTT
jgi:hypothetical protein